MQSFRKAIVLSSFPLVFKINNLSIKKKRVVPISVLHQIFSPLPILRRACTVIRLANLPFHLVENLG
nr:MAG TPA: hypothetical protein [Caudoviricetes sp.]